jgi:hypothetical protein
MTLDKGLRAMPFADRDVWSERPACSLSRIRMTQASDARNFMQLCSPRAADSLCPHLLQILCSATRDAAHCHFFLCSTRTRSSGLFCTIVPFHRLHTAAAVWWGGELGGTSTKTRFRPPAQRYPGALTQ